MKTLFGYWPYLVVAALAFGLGYLRFDKSDELEAAKRAEAAHKARANGLLIQRDAMYNKVQAGLVENAKLQKMVDSSAKKATELRAVTHPTVRKPNAYLNPSAPASVRVAVLASADSLLNALSTP